MKRWWIVAQGLFCWNSCWSEAVFVFPDEIYLWSTFLEGECQLQKIFLRVEICTTSFKMPHLIHSLKANTSPLNIGHWPQKENSSDSTFLNSQLFRGKKPPKTPTPTSQGVGVFCVDYMGVSKNSGTPKSSILIGFIDHPFWGTPIFGKPHILGGFPVRLNPQEHHIVRMYPKAVQRYPPETIPYYKACAPYQL